MINCVLIDVAPDKSSIGVLSLVVFFVLALVVLFAAGLFFFIRYRKRKVRE